MSKWPCTEYRLAVERLREALRELSDDMDHAETSYAQGADQHADKPDWRAANLASAATTEIWRQRVLALAAAATPPSLDVERERDHADALRWRAAEAEGHVVDFTEDGYGLMHPPSCRPNLIGCDFNAYLAERDEPDMPPGRYSMRWSPSKEPVYAATGDER